jgi:hypothetical protein
MNPDSLALISEAEKLARVADEIVGSFAVELARVLRDLERELRTLALEAAEGSRTAIARGVRAAKLRRQIQDALRAAGYDSLADTASGISLDRLVAQMERLRGAAKLAAFTSSDMTRILALKELARLDLLQQGEAISFALWRTFVQGLFSQRPVNDLLDDLADAIDVEASEARTLYDTTASVFGRQVEAMKSREGDVFVFLGPTDQKLRPFCREHVGKVYTREQIDVMDNGQLPNVFLTAGGYNCRHNFVAVSKLSELRALVGTDQRMPEIAEAVARLPVKAGKKAA